MKAHILAAAMLCLTTGAWAADDTERYRSALNAASARANLSIAGTITPCPPDTPQVHYIVCGVVPRAPAHTFTDTTGIEIDK